MNTSQCVQQGSAIRQVACLSSACSAAAKMRWSALLVCFTIELQHACFAWLSERCLEAACTTTLCQRIAEDAASQTAVTKAQKVIVPRPN